MRWLIFALLSALIVSAALFSCSEKDSQPTSSAETMDEAERLDLLDERLRDLASKSGELAGYFSETGVGEQLGELSSRLLQIKVALDRTREGLDAEDPLLRDAAARMIPVHEEALSRQERGFTDFRLLFERTKLNFIDAFGRHRRVNQMLARLIELGTPCPEEQATAREVGQVYLNGRRFFFGELGKTLAGEKPDDTVLQLATGSFRQTHDGLQELYQRLLPIDIEINRMQAQVSTLTPRLAWARSTREKLGDDPWLATSEADLGAATEDFEALKSRMEALQRDALGQNFIADARGWVEDAAALLRRVNAYLEPARKAGLPLPR